ncbi:nucleotidyltransferase domain-containing protein [Candidatus Aminicenantes bacterium AC-708-M15]|jgi:predicted nucleotidyltransferase|nr:nucleotidyltransferase domain-containing protein [SCandidatus Aminicenantes bacterium Aminicenantia_JdfR_composite]MCP2596506.1 nucleotidyltransferase domain-containing protein [Candidatus Aminicenantes bacterium AC-335-G13]MCP2603903.1 nucleotidyltransferase domain-containing protein [Candidatus Aminicenantes bacterium AC-708-M15]MCP2605715.1 nucleotidyltransferase domain-containing protein [Candidatus Aminicenantes bacterium AC-335-O07]MCP2618100.1 nucleotidyltransferase domain-containing 
MEKIKSRIEYIAKKYNLQLIYAFGSRAKQALKLVEGEIKNLPPGTSDLDIGIKSEKNLNIDEKVEITQEFESLFNVPKVDLVILQNAPVFLALEIVTGELLYTKDSTFEAEYQLYIMRRAAELLPYERMRQKMILGEKKSV